MYEKPNSVAVILDHASRVVKDMLYREGLTIETIASMAESDIVSMTSIVAKDLTERNIGAVLRILDKLGKPIQLVAHQTFHRVNPQEDKLAALFAEARDKQKEQLAVMDKIVGHLKGFPN